MRALCFLVLLAGCGKNEPMEPAEPNRSTPVRPSERPRDEPRETDIVGIGTLWNAYIEDAAKATRTYGERPWIRLTVDDVRKTSTGFVVERETPPAKHRVYFPVSAAAKLEGVKGKTIVIRGKVTADTRTGLVIHAE